MRKRASQAGMTLIEILVALAILLVVAVAIIELFSLSYLVNMGSLARTDLQYRAERVAESLRYLRALPDTVPIPSGCPNLRSITGPVAPTTIPNDPSDSCWGVAGFRVVEQANNPFVLSYEITDGGPVWVITVTARPAGTGPRYLGMAIAAKGVRYVAQVAK